ncbi:MAG: T9SS type A sorting domain-containing protein [Saprospiraceae bacterium]|nr:T9SS type A sorting domain-containing protein [Saprospiraceae bacterium]
MIKSIRNNFLFAFLAGIILLCATGNDSSERSSVMNIAVFAGFDRTMCYGTTLTLSELNATITGAVSNGQWFTTGDGKFMPGNQTSVVFTVGTHYVPGPFDIATGNYRLLLVSDDPDLDPITGSNGPLVQVSDDVRITFQNAPPLFCNNNLNISLDGNCQQVVDITILQSNPTPPFNHYNVALFDQNGIQIPNNLLTKIHIGKEISFKIGHACTQNICWGKFTVSDYYPPVFVCKNDTLPCTRSVLPDSLGFPFPTGAYIDTIINGKYKVLNWDACGLVTLEYKDEITKANCTGNLDRTIKRSWKAVDESGNVSNCIQQIVLNRIPLSLVLFPPNFDDQQMPAFDCLDTFPRYANGYPSVDTTGIPFIGGCTHLQQSFSDTEFPLCGSSYKLVRSWFVIDWCTAESVSRNQLILIKDSKGPKFICQDSITLFAGAYACASDLVDIPVPQQVTDCSEWNYTVSLSNLSGQLLPQFIVANGQHFRFSGLPFGKYTLTYTLSDLCTNTSRCQTKINVIDNLPPYPVCDQITKVAVAQDGRGRVFALTLDDGSTDNCGIKSFKVRKMTDACNFGLVFGDFVDFCCVEIGQEVMVALQVTDLHDNVNTCMVQVLVEDKIPPVILCPSNLTISCTTPVDTLNLNNFGKVVNTEAARENIIIHDAYNNGVAGRDGLATDNCSVNITSTFTQNLHCSQGTIQRIFTATDTDGRQSSCTQLIFVRNPAPFKQSDIIWPAHFSGEGCRSDQTDPAMTGKPTYLHTSCSLIASTYEDQAFYLADSACVKIIRSWTVIDWCQFDEITGFGKWGPYIQVIKLSNDVAPVITGVCRDTTICSYDPLCQNGFIDIFQNATDECTHTTDLKWTFQIDLFNNGSIDSTGSINAIIGYFPLGTHKVSWQVADGCGNITTCSQKVTITDCKKPTPYCISSVTVAVMQPSGIIEIWAKDYDLGSNDNCTAKEQLKFSFSPDTSHTYRTFSCQDIPDGKSEKVSVNMYVTDEHGNNDFCSVELILQDNANVCPDLITSGYVDGTIKTETGRAVKSVNVRTRSDVENNHQTTITDFLGYFYFENLPSGNDYVIKPSYNADPINGLTTLDLVLIQRHILGLQPLNSPYKIIAADANGSNSVTASDLVDLRKLILGITNTFPKSRPSWLFVDKKYNFPDPTNPWFAPDSVFVNGLESESLNHDFVAVKLGDVNDSHTLFDDESLENRSDNYIDLTYGIHLQDGKPGLYFKTNENIVLDGLQLFIRSERPGSLSDIHFSELKSTADYYDFHQDNENLNVVVYNANPQIVEKGSVLLNFSFENEQLTESLAFQLQDNKVSELYVDGKTYKIRLKSEIQTGNFHSHKIRLLSNPVLNQLHLLVPPSGNAEFSYPFEIKDVNGRIVMNGFIPGYSDESEYQVQLYSVLNAGIYFIQVSDPYGMVQTIKFIKLDH